MPGVIQDQSQPSDTNPGHGMLDQAAELQPMNYAVLYEFSIPLKLPNQLAAWRCAVTQILRMWMLDPLIDLSIPHPPRGSPRYGMWLEASKEVCNWLAWNLGFPLIMLVESTRVPSLLADEFMNNAMQVISEATSFGIEPHTDVSNMIHALICVTHCTREGWPNARTFVYRLMEFYHRTERYSMNIPAFLPLSVLFDQLRFEFPDFITAKLEEVQNLPNAAQDVTPGSFVLHCHDVLEYIDQNVPDSDIETGVSEENTEMTGSDESLDSGSSEI